MDEVLNLSDKVYERLYNLFSADSLPDRVEIIFKNKENKKIRK